MVNLLETAGVTEIQQTTSETEVVAGAELLDAQLFGGCLRFDTILFSATYGLILAKIIEHDRAFEINIGLLMSKLARVGPRFIEDGALHISIKSFEPTGQYLMTHHPYFVALLLIGLVNLKRNSGSKK